MAARPTEKLSTVQLVFPTELLFEITRIAQAQGRTVEELLGLWTLSGYEQALAELDASEEEVYAEDLALEAAATRDSPATKPAKAPRKPAAKAPAKKGGARGRGK